MFGTILIANRGEIACRVIRTARRLGVRTVAVYSEADAKALHVEMADEAHPIGPAPAQDSYLSIGNILKAAEESGAQAIHPGYGFLSENAAFAEACGKAGIVFIGPPAAAIRAMGSKSAAKTLMEKSGIPLVPGYHGKDQSMAVLRKAAAQIGYPVLIKAASGGGGKGMRIVAVEAELEQAVQSAKREAAAAFGDDDVLIEKYLTRPRHIEIQVFADTLGNAVHLFERDCSIQRRHQKVIEEAPAPGLDAATRTRMGEAACAAARAIGYVGAGTVEFIAEDGRFYFMEMNTRLQVEHPVTEAVTGQDLVEWQLRVAAGEPLPLCQDQLVLRGHAIEARIYAEDPARSFLPSIGVITHLRGPEVAVRVRIDTGVRSGDAISIHYDPMIAKLIAWGGNRDEACRRLSRALSHFEVTGPTTNTGFLKRIADHPAFRGGEVDTGFIPRHGADLFPPLPPVPQGVLAAAAMRVLLDDHTAAGIRAARSPDPYSPWHTTHGWRINGVEHRELIFTSGGEKIIVRALALADGTVRLDLPQGPVTCAGQDIGGNAIALSIDGVRRSMSIIRTGNALAVPVDGQVFQLTLVDPFAGTGDESAASGRLIAPMPGRVTQVSVKAGTRVRKGEALLVLEAMKMEHTIVAPTDGTVEKLPFGTGDIVAEGAELVVFAAEPA